MAITAKKISKPKKKEAAKSNAQRIIALAQIHSSRIPAQAWKGVPSDLAKNDEHYLYGDPKVK